MLFINETKKLRIFMENIRGIALINKKHERKIGRISIGVAGGFVFLGQAIRR
jgi:hypothetical protein